MQTFSRLWREWSAGPERLLLGIAAPLVFSRSDNNLANCLWDGTSFRFIDFENAAWCDRTIDLAEQVEHVQSRGTPEEDWGWFVELFELSAVERQRYEAARRLMAFFWGGVYLSGGATADAERRERFARQVERIRVLCGGYTA